MASVISSCKYSTEYKTINADNQFSISIPPWMDEQKDLKDGAIFQYANRFRNTYVIAEVQSRQTANQTNAEIMSQNLTVISKAMDKPIVSDSVAIEVGDLTGTRVEIYGKMNAENIYFTEVLLQGKIKLYHISIWTRSEDRKLHFKEDISQIISSFKEI